MKVAEYQTYALHTLDSIAGLIRRAPADKLDWRPCESCMELGQLLGHAAGSLTQVVKIAVTGQMGPQAEMDGDRLKRMTPDEALALVERQKDGLRQLLASMTDGRWLNEEVTMPWGFHGTLAAVGTEAVDHAAGHRYQLFLYLKLLGQPLSTMELYGMEAAAG